MFFIRGFQQKRLCLTTGAYYAFVASFRMAMLKQHCISEALKYLKYINKRISQQKQQLITILQNINSYKTDLYDYTKLSWRYIAGMFDSEGCISLNYKKLQIHKLHICISICQCYVPNFLISIQQFIKHELNICLYHVYIKKQFLKYMIILNNI